MWKHTLVATTSVVVLLLLLLCSARSTQAVPTTDSSESKDSVAATKTEIITPAASTPDYQRQHHENHENINQLGDDEPVRYDGAQVWRLRLTDAREKNAVSDLQHSFGNSLTEWNVDGLLVYPMV